MNTCSVDDCPKTEYRHGYCSMHNSRLTRYGDLSRGHQRQPAEDRFWPKVDKTPTCWIWTGARHGMGYGNFFATKYMLAHRFSYELANGPIPDGLTLDHLCRNRLCVNPDHLEPVTIRENLMRGIGPSAIAARTTHCPKGHEYSGLNIYWAKNGKRICRLCRVGPNAKTHRRLWTHRRQVIASGAKSDPEVD